MKEQIENGKVLDMIASPVAVLTCNEGETLNGMTLAWICQVSYNPPIVVFSVAESRYSYELIASTGRVGINLLHEDATSCGKHFGFTSGRDVNKFSNIHYIQDEDGIPILENDVTYYLHAKVLTSYLSGDHYVFHAEIDSLQQFSDKSPLLFKRSDFF